MLFLVLGTCGPSHAKLNFQYCVFEILIMGKNYHNRKNGSKPDQHNNSGCHLNLYWALMNNNNNNISQISGRSPCCK